MEKLRVEFDEKKIDALFADIDQGPLPGAAVGIAIGGKPVYRKGFGLASMELPVILSPTMRMRIGSTTKHFTSLAYLLLCEEGKAQLDDPVGKYFPELHPVTHQVTMRQLMGHVGGLRDAYDVIWSFSGTGRAASTADMLSFYRDIDDVSADPGAVWSYNNGGYVILSVAIERITGRSLEEVLRERIFEPVAMYDTLLRRLDTDFVPNSATLHTLNTSFTPTSATSSDQPCSFDRSYMGMAIAGEGGIVSTVNDMLRWLAHMDSPVVGSAATWATMKTPLTLSNGTPTGYGLGLIADRYRGVETLSHSGRFMGGNSQMLKIPSAGLDVVIMVNRSDVSGPLLVNGILDACLPALRPVEELSHRAAVTGLYRSPRTGRVIQLFNKGGQQFASVDACDVPVVHAGDRELRPAPVMAFWKLKLTWAGDLQKPESIRFDYFGNLDELVPVQPADRANVAIAGRYRSEATRTDLTIVETGNGAQVLCNGRFGSTTYDLECLADGIWRAKPRSAMPYDALLCFDNAGHFDFFTNRTWKLPFRRAA